MSLTCPLTSRAYEQQLANWYLLGGFDVNYGTWGW